MILLYHKVGRLKHDYNDLGVTPENFRYQLEYINKHYGIVPLEKIKDPEISVTFDDGFRDFYTEVYPYLSENRIPVTLFIATGRISSTEELWTSELLRLIFTDNNHRQCFHMKVPMFAYDFAVQSLEDKIILYRALRRICMKSEEEIVDDVIKQLRVWAGMGSIGREEYRFLTEEEIKILSQDPLITIGGHTHNHVSLGAFTKKYQEKEIMRSKEILERIIGREIQYFSYPFGGENDYNEETIEILERTGFQKAYTTQMHTGENMPYEIPRIAVPNLGKGEFELWFDKVVMKQDAMTKLHSLTDRKIAYIGRLRDDEQLLQTSNKIAIFGAGVRGKKLYRELKAYGKDLEVVCFIDNDKIKQGGNAENKPVLAVEQIKEAEVEIILLDSIWEKEIIDQLIQCGIGGIHWIIN